MQYNITLPQPVAIALQEAEGYEYSSQVTSFPANLLPKAPYKIGLLIDALNNFYNSNNIEISGIIFDISAKTANNGNATIHLTEKEAAIIKFLSSSTKEVTKDEMLKAIWQYSEDATTNTAETHIYRLRQKLTESFGLPVIDTVGSNYSIKK